MSPYWFLQVKGLACSIRVLFDLHIQKWVKKLDASSKGKFYSGFKQDLTFQIYLSKLNSKHYLPITKFRTSNRKLPVETDRWENFDFCMNIWCRQSIRDILFNYSQRIFCAQ